MMTSINGETVITMTLKHLIGGVVATVIAVAGAFWGITTFTLGNLKDDVSDIRDAVTAAQDRNANTHQMATTADGDLRAQIASLTAELKVTNSGLAGLTTSVSGLDASIQGMDVKLTQSVERQSAFERLVLIKLGPLGPDKANLEIPLDWQKTSGEIFQTLTKGNDPLVDWYKGSVQP